jgi:endonuclease/exonuclease/phosphatase family metal-dependent hydrolase
MKAKKRLPLIDRFFLWLNYAFCAALLISYLAPVTDPRKAWVIAFFGLGYPIILTGNIILIFYWAIRQRWPIFLSAVCILCGLTVLNNNVGFHHSQLPKPAKAIRLITYNVHNFKKFGSNKDISTKHEILSLIQQQQPDVIGFQEYYTRRKGQYDMTDSIKKIMQSKECYVESFEGNADEIIGMAIFSRFPIINRGMIPLSEVHGSGNQCMYVDVKKDSATTIRLYSVHLQSIKFEPQDYQYLDTMSKGSADMQGTRRLGSKLKIAFLKRAEQVFKIKDHAAQCPYPYIISGDFNDTPASFAVNQMQKGLKNAFAEKGFGLGRTYNGDFPNYQIDYVMASRQFNVSSYGIIKKKLSDHYPVVSDLEVSDTK